MIQLLDLPETLRCHVVAGSLHYGVTHRQPSFGKIPIAPDGARRDVQSRHDFLLRQSAEITQLDHLSLARRDLRERGQCVV